MATIKMSKEEVEQAEEKVRQNILIERRKQNKIWTIIIICFHLFLSIGLGISSNSGEFGQIAPLIRILAIWGGISPFTALLIYSIWKSRD